MRDRCFVCGAVLKECVDCNTDYCPIDGGCNCEEDSNG